MNDNNIFNDIEIGSEEIGNGKKKYKLRPIRLIKKNGKQYIRKKNKLKEVDNLNENVIYEKIRKQKGKKAKISRGSRNEMIKILKKETEELLESELNEKDEELKKINFEYDEAVKNLYEENKEEKINDEQKEEYELTKIKEILDESNNEYDEKLNEFIENEMGLLPSEMERKLTEKFENEEYKKKYFDKINELKQTIQGHKLEEEKINEDDYFKRQELINEHRKKLYEDINKNVLKNNDIKYIITGTTLEEENEILNEIDKELLSGEITKKQAKEFRSEFFENEKKELEFDKNPVSSIEYLKEINKEIEENDKIERLMLEDIHKYDENIKEKVEEIYYDDKDYEKALKNMENFYEELDNEKYNVEKEELVQIKDKEKEEIENELLDKIKMEEEFIDEEEHKTKEILMEKEDEEKEMLEHFEKREKNYENALKEKHDEEIKQFIHDEELNYENKIDEEKNKYEKMIEELEEDWSEKYINDENELYNEEESIEHHFIDKLNEEEEKQEKEKKEEMNFMLLSSLQHKKIQQDQQKMEKMTEKKTMEELEDDIKEKHEKKKENDLNYEKKVRKYFIDNYENIEKNVKITNEMYDEYYDEIYKPEEILKETQKNPEFYEHEEEKNEEEGQGNNNENGLYNYEIDEIMKDEENYIGTFSFSDLEEILDNIDEYNNKFAFIINTHENNHVHNKHLFHWLAIGIDKYKKTIYFYDSLNLKEDLNEFIPFLKELSEELSQNDEYDTYYKLKIHDHEDEAFNTNTCGLYAIRFVKEFFNDNIKEYETKSIFI